MDEDLLKKVKKLNAFHEIVDFPFSIQKEILNMDETAQLFNVSVKTFIKLLKEESVPGRKIGREWRFSRKALLDWLSVGDSKVYSSSESETKKYFDEVAPHLEEVRKIKSNPQALVMSKLKELNKNMNILIKNVGIITGDLSVDYISNGFIGIKDGIIDFVGTSDEASRDFKYEKIIDGSNSIVMAGLVNAHSHSPMTILRNFADDLALEEWLFERVIPIEGKLLPEDIYWGTMLGITEMIKSGTTCFADMYMHMEEVAKAVLQSGIRANISKGPLVSGFRGKEGISVDIDGCSQYYKNWNNSANGRIKVYIEIHSVYLYGEETLREAASLAKQLGTGIHIHVLETIKEKETSLEKYGMSVAQACLEFGIFDVPTIAAHCVHLTDNDIKILADRKVNAVHNPTSNLKLGSGISRVPEMLDSGINVCLGTDGAASNNNLNMFEEMNLSALIHKGVKMNPQLINADMAIKMATANGAKGLGFGEEIGSLKKGAKADLIILNIDKPHLCPVNNPISAIVYSAQASDVETVIVDGKILMENRELKTIDEELVKAKVRGIARKLMG